MHHWAIVIHQAVRNMVRLAQHFQNQLRVFHLNWRISFACVSMINGHAILNDDVRFCRDYRMHDIHSSAFNRKWNVATAKKCIKCKDKLRDKWDKSKCDYIFYRRKKKHLLHMTRNPSKQSLPVLHAVICATSHSLFIESIHITIFQGYFLNIEILKPVFIQFLISAKIIQ